MTRVATIFGGKSSEHEISLLSAFFVIGSLQAAGFSVVKIGITKDGQWLLTDASLEEIKSGEWQFRASNVEVTLKMSGDQPSFWLLQGQAHELEVCEIDVVFPILHGKNGEDGTIQGLFEMACVPYVGCGVLASVVCMDKALFNQVLRDAKLPHVDWCTTGASKLSELAEADLLFCQKHFAAGVNLFVKPANAGSSVGITKAHCLAELDAALGLARLHDHRIIIEVGLESPREIELAVLEINGKSVVSHCGEIIPTHEFYDFDAKYRDGSSRLVIPAKLSPETSAALQAMAHQVYQLVDARGLMRVDFFVQNEEIWINEINTMPGFTEISMYPRLMRDAGISDTLLMKELVATALNRGQ